MKPQDGEYFRPALTFFVPPSSSSCAGSTGLSKRFSSVKSCQYLVLSGKTFQRPGLQSVGVPVFVSGKTLEAMSLELEPPGGTSSTSAQRKRDSDPPSPYPVAEESRSCVRHRQAETPPPPLFFFCKETFFE